MLRVDRIYLIHCGVEVGSKVEQDGLNKGVIYEIMGEDE
jgi:hypothetical protein